MKIRKMAAITAAVASIGGGTAALAATAASAATASPAAAQLVARHTYQAVSYLANRPDSGGNGNWAYDNIHRTLTIRLLGSTGTGSSTLYYYSATVKDNGSFKTIDGAYTPNQSGSYAGDTISGAVPGTLNGQASFAFTANALPSALFNLGLPTVINGAADSTSTWYELAFPADTTFGGPGIGSWGWHYNGPEVVTLDSTGKHVLNVSHERWADTSADNDGQLAADGNIDGFGH
jgi:hypothetical protein